MQQTAFSPFSLRGSAIRWYIWVVLSSISVSIPAILLLLNQFATSEILLVILFFLPGITLGVAQWLCLRSLKDAFLWIVATALGSPIFLFGILRSGPYSTYIPISYSSIIYSFSASVIMRASIASLFSLPSGVLQWIFLRRYFIKAGQWIIVAWAGYFLGLLAFFALLPIIVSGNLIVMFVLIGVSMGAMPAAITGGLLLSFKPISSQ